MRVSGAELSRFVHGCAELEPGEAGGVLPHRLPAWARAQVDDILFRYAEACPAGVSLRFDTSADSVLLTIGATTIAAPDAEIPPLTLMLRRDGREHAVTGPVPTVRLIGPERTVIGIREQAPQTIEVPLTGTGPVELVLPHNARMELVALEADAELTAVASDGFRWTHYGSSISQGLNATVATRTWPAAAARRLGWGLRDLSFAGNAQLDGCVARVIRDAPADLITLKVGINLLNADSMRERAFLPAMHAFLDTIREGQPDTPIVLISAVSCPIHEHSPGPVVGDPDGLMRAAHREVETDDGALTLARTREILEAVVAARDDAALTYFDGRELFGPADVELLFDRLHPDQRGLDLIAERFVAAFGARTAGMR